MHDLECPFNFSLINFFTLNKHKIKFFFLFSSLTLSISISILFFWTYYQNKGLPDIELLAAILLTAWFGFPMFILILSYTGWKINGHYRKRAFKTSPFNKLDTIGFKETYVNWDTKWHFTTVAKVGIVNGYPILCDIDESKPKFIVFQAFFKLKKLDKKEFSRLSAKFKPYRIEFDFDSINQKYNIKKSSETIESLKIQLTKFTEILQEESFEPIDIEHRNTAG